MTYSHDPAFAQAADEQDKLKHSHKQFLIPVANGGKVFDQLSDHNICGLAGTGCHPHRPGTAIQHIF